MKSVKTSTRAGCECRPITKAWASFWTYAAHRGEFYGRIFAICVLLSVLLALAPVAPAFGQTPYFQEVHSIYSSRMGLSGPFGLAYVNRTGTMLVVPRADLARAGWGSSLNMISITGHPQGKVTLPLVVQNPLDVAFSETAGALYILDPSSRILFKIPVSTAGQLGLETSLVEATSLSSLPLRNPTGITFDPASGTLYILDGGQHRILSITPKSQQDLGAADAQKEGRLQIISVEGTGLVNPRGIAFDPQTRSLYILSPAEKKLYQLAETGQFLSIIDISGFELVDPEGMTIAPSADATDDPANMNLFIADTGISAGQFGPATGGKITEFSLTAPTLSATALTAPTVTPALVQTIDTSLWTPPSPDPCGMKYFPSLGNYLVPDCEVDEIPTLFTGVNIYEMTPDGRLVGAFTTTPIDRSGWSNEPTDITYNAQNGHWFVSDDDKHRVFEIDLGPDKTYGTSDDTITSIDTNTFGSDDPEGVDFDSEHQILYVADGVNTEVYKVSPGPNGIFDGVDDVVTHFDTAVLGMTDLEGIDYNPYTQTIYLSGGTHSTTIYEVTPDGTAVRFLDISSAPSFRSPAGLAYGPGSSGFDTRSLYMANRNYDNNGHPDENDGTIYEFLLPGPIIASYSPTSGGVSTSVTINGTGFTGTTSVKFNGANATYTISSDTQIIATVPSGATKGPVSVTTPGGTAVSASDFTPTTGGPGVSLSPASLSFGSQVVSTTSAAQTVTVTNDGSSDLHITTVVLGGSNPGDFGKSSDNCSGATVTPTSSCTVSVTFTPTTTGSRTAALNINDDVTPSPQTVSLSGTGTSPSVSLSPASLSFGSQVVSTTSAAQTVTVTNDGSGDLHISTVGFTGTNPGDFGKNSDNCSGKTVTPTNSCTIGVTFTPSGTGARSASLSISDDAAGSPQAVPLSGTGTTPSVSLTPTSLSFGSQAVSTTSAAQTVTVTNDGSSDLHITTVVLGGSNPGDFGKSSDNCSGATVTPTSSCTVSVTFTPTTTGSRTAALNINDDVTPSPQTVSLSGTGTSPSVSLSPASLSFGSQVVSTTSAAQTVTVTNDGSGDLHISTVGFTGTNPGDFATGTDNCSGKTVTPTNSCTIGVTFTPSGTGARSASLNINDDVTPSPQTVPLTGNGIAPSVSLTPTSLDFGDQTESVTSSPQAVTLTNTGTADLSVTSIVASGDFAQTNTCGTSVAAGASCNINVTFTPAATGIRTGAVTITDNASPSTQTVSLTGNGVAAAPSVSLTPTSLTFPNQEVNTTSTAQPVTLTNTGTADLTVTSVTASGDFAATGCVGTVAAGANCTINVTFTPTGAGTRTGAVTITDNAGTQTVSLTGTGVLPPPVVSSVVFSPNPCLAGSTCTLQIFGNYFAPGASVSFSGVGRSPNVDSLIFKGSGEIDVTVTTYTNGPKRNRDYDVTVTNPDGSSGTLPAGFTVTF